MNPLFPANYSVITSAMFENFSIFFRRDGILFLASLKHKHARTIPCPMIIGEGSFEVQVNGKSKRLLRERKKIISRSGGSVIHSRVISYLFIELFGVIKCH